MVARFDAPTEKAKTRLKAWRIGYAKAGAAASSWFAEALPKGLFARALLIIITPIVVLEGRHRVRLHGTPLAISDAPLVRGHRAQHRRADRTL